MLSKDSRGFTLIEVTIVVAITALFGIVAIYGRGYSKDSAEWQSGFDRIRTEVFQVKNEAQSTVHHGTGDSYNALLPSKGIVFWGKVVEFCNLTNGVPCGQMRVRTLLDNGSPTLLDAASFNAEETRLIDLGNGVSLDMTTTLSLSAGTSFAFVRDPQTGTLKTYVLSIADIPTQKSSYTGANENATGRYRFVHLNPSLRGNLIISKGNVQKEIVP
jgi:prepilin-type N-terminal cleavage/methylation domain-containing protein